MVQSRPRRTVTRAGVREEGQEGRDIAEVIRLTEQKLRELKPSPGSATITELVTQAHMFREVRNYALHPVEEHDGDRETWLTETGATLLAIAARRYFVKLAGSAIDYRPIDLWLTRCAPPGIAEAPRRRSMIPCTAATRPRG